MNVCPTEQIGVIEIGWTGILARHLLVGQAFVPVACWWDRHSCLLG
jgi:hypothetical protein